MCSAETTNSRKRLDEDYGLLWTGKVGRAQEERANPSGENRLSLQLAPFEALVLREHHPIVRCNFSNPLAVSNAGLIREVLLMDDDIRAGTEQCVGNMTSSEALVQKECEIRLRRRTRSGSLLRSLRSAWHSPRRASQRTRPP